MNKGQTPAQNPLAGNPVAGSLIIGKQSPALRQTLWRLIADIQRDDIMAPVTVVAPSRYAGLSLRQDLGQTGFINVRFIQLPVLAELLGGAALSAEGRRPLTSALRSILLREALAQAPDSLSQVGAHPKTQSSLGNSFRELRLLDESALRQLEAQGGLNAEVVGLYRSYRQNAAGDWYDAEDLAASAAQAVDAQQAFALSDLGHIVFYLPGMVGRAERDLVKALAEKGLCSVILGKTGDAQADGVSDSLVADLEPLLGPPLVSPTVTEAGPADCQPGAEVLPGEASLCVAANTHEEIRGVIRQIFQESRASGTPFHRMAVLYRMENPYGTLIADELAMAGIPLAGPARTTLAESATGRTLLGLLSMVDSDYRRDEVMAWLTGCPVKLPGGAKSGSSPSPSHWDALSRRAGIVAGLEQWRARLSAYSHRQEDEALQGETKGEITESRAIRMRADARSAARLLEFIEGLAAAATPPPPGSSWTAHSIWAKGLLDSYLPTAMEDEGTGASERLQSEFESIAKTLEELKSADTIKAATSREEFMRALTDALQAPAGHLGTTGKGVFVSPFRTAIGMDFDVVWLVGMIEGGAPPAIRPDPLLPERLGAAANVPSRFARLAAEERYNYLSAASTAPRRILSYPVSDSSSRREAHPSRWFLEQASALAGKPVHSRTLPAFAQEPWLTIAASAERSLAEITDDAVADTLDYNLHRLLAWKTAGHNSSRHPLAAGGTLYRAGLLRRSRANPALTEFDGNLSAIADTAGFVQNLVSSPISPSRLESWATCPFRYFLAYLLRLGALETPEDTATISPLQRGNLVHRILERFFSETAEAGLFPEPYESWQPEDQQRLMGIAEEQFHLAESSGVTGKPLLWRMEKLDLRDDLARFLEEDSRLRSRFAIARTAVEASFGYAGATPDVVDSETGLRFRGSIDRLDVTTDPDTAQETALVIDYKTGSAGPYRRLDDDPIDGGKRLQLGIYSLAARQLAPEASRLSAAYWFISARGGFSLVPGNYFDIDDEETGKRFREGVTAIREGIRSGAFPANPGPRDGFGLSNCRFCDFDSLCPSRREQMWEIKKLDPAVAGYRQLTETDSAQVEDAGE